MSLLSCFYEMFCFKVLLDYFENPLWGGQTKSKAISMKVLHALIPPQNQLFPRSLYFIFPNLHKIKQNYTAQIFVWLSSEDASLGGWYLFLFLLSKHTTDVGCIHLKKKKKGRGRVTIDKQGLISQCVLLFWLSRKV